MTRLIVTNDDGVHAPGILALANALSELGDIQVIAPSINQSASGHKKTLFQDIAISEVQMADGTPATSVGGSPADCIALAALGLLNWPPALVVSGINRGANLAQDVTYSGTVTAALEAAIFGVPAIAVSLDNRDANDPADYAEAARVAVAVARVALTRPLPLRVILNLNVPNVERVRGIRLTRQGVRIYRDVLNRNGSIARMEGPEPIGEYEHEATDVWAVHHGYASITPIHLDMTAHQFMADLSAWDLQV
jgi:5'-nucleotidase